MIKLQPGTGTTNNGGLITIKSGVGVGSGKTYYEVKTRTHTLELDNKLNNTHCKMCRYEFIQTVNGNVIYTDDLLIKDLTCNEVIMKDVIE